MVLEVFFIICKVMLQFEIGEMVVVSFGEKGNVCFFYDFDQMFLFEFGLNMIL